MDALTGLLDGPRAHGAFAVRVTMDPPWSVRVQDESPLALIAVVAGSACVAHDGTQPVLLEAGDLALVNGPVPYTFADRPDTPPQAIIHPGQRCTGPWGEELEGAMDVGVRSWGNSRDGSAVSLIGTYERRSEVSRRLLSALPPVVVVDGRDWPLVDLLAVEMGRDDPGQELVLDRLLDLLVVAVLRTWFDRPDQPGPSWYRARADPVVGPALRLLEHHVAHPWTVGELAHEVGASRAVLARRFSELVGEPPITYLTGWRLALAADLLREPGSTIAAVAAEVGYATPFALSAAFKRVRGVSPAEHRAAAG